MCCAADLLIALAGPLTHVPQFLIWFGALFPVYHAVYGSWHISLAIPPPAEHFGLAVVAGGCQVSWRAAGGCCSWCLLHPRASCGWGRVWI